MRLLVRLKAKKWRILTGAAMVALASYVSVQYFESGDIPAPAPRVLSQAASDALDNASKKGDGRGASTRSGMEVYIDPKTGQFRKPPAGKKLEGAQPLQPADRGEGASSHASDRIFEEQASPVVGGGMVTNVHLRFRRPLVATRDENGKLSIQHAPQEADLKGEQ